MKLLFLSLLIMVGLDQVCNHGAGVKACSSVVTRLAHNTESEVSGSVFRE